MEGAANGAGLSVVLEEIAQFLARNVSSPLAREIGRMASDEMAKFALTSLTKTIVELSADEMENGTGRTIVFC